MFSVLGEKVEWSCSASTYRFSCPIGETTVQSLLSDRLTALLTINFFTYTAFTMLLQ